MGALAWIIVGVVAGFLATALTPRGREDDSNFLGAMMSGVVGAVTGGWIWNLFLAQPGAPTYDFYSLTVAFMGAVLVILVLRRMERKPTTY